MANGIGFEILVILSNFATSIKLNRVVVSIIIGQ